jgi:cephalosporin hydroxylase
MSKYKELYEQAAKHIGVLQVETEVLPFMEYLDTEVKPVNILEIGLCQGGSFYLWAKLAQPAGIKLGIDLPNGRWGVPYTRSKDEIAINKHNIQMFAPNIDILWGESKDTKSIDWVKEQLGDQKLDLLFIDGDHSYLGAKIDYANYSPFVKEGGIIALHDIKESELHKANDCNVYKFWQELEGEKKEFVDMAVEWGGIGVIKV